MNDFGARLKAARVKSGVSLREIATTTKISVAALEALEREDYSRLPGGIFSRAFIRAYALQVGLEPEATVNEFLTELQRFERESKVATRIEITPEDQEFLERQRRAQRWLKLVAVLLFLTAIAIAAWQTRSLWQTPPPSPPPPAPSAPHVG
jgi:cytoskeletal protein RodZ